MTIFDVGQRTLVKYHFHVPCWLIVEVETFMSAGTDTVGPLAPTSSFHWTGQVACLSADSIPKIVSIVGDLQHLHMLCHAELTDTTVSVDVTSIPVLKGTFFGIVGGPRVWK
jgi:hypothetical protein